MIKDQIKLKKIDSNEALNIISKTFKNCEHNTLDGLKLIWDDSWLHIRKSNTEPIIRIYAEATSKETAKKLIGDVKQCIQ